MQTLFPLTVPTLAIHQDARRFPVRRIYCVARNYADHAIEMGGSGREAPFFFMKPGDAAFTGAALPYPPQTSDLHHEVEMVAAIGQGGRNIAVQDAEQHIFGYGVGIDFTRRDVQAELKKLGRPWELAKSFDHAAPVSTLMPAAVCGHPQRGAITLTINNETRQSGDLSQMIWSAVEIVSILSNWFELMPGDLVFTGTPAGVGPVARGDTLLAQVAGLADLRLSISAD